MKKIISVINQKGGSGKTTTTVNLAAALVELGQKVLILDMDPQAHSTLHLGIMPTDVKRSVFDLIMKIETADAIIKKTSMEGLGILPSHLDLATADLKLLNEVGRENLLKDSLNNPVVKNYDFIIIDCPPALGILTINALTASTDFIIPIQCGFFALEGTARLLGTVELIKSRINNSLNLLGVVITRYDSRKNFSKDIVAQVKKHFNDVLFNTYIRDNVRLDEATSNGQTIIQYDSKSYGAEDYRSLARELLDRVH